MIILKDDGYTITEQLVASLFTLVVVGTLYGFYRDQLFHLVSQEAKTATLEDARGALDIIIRDLRNAGSWGTGSAPSEMDSAQDPKNIDDPNSDADAVCNRVYAATKKLLIIQMDLNGDADCMDYPDHPTAGHGKDRETIKYELTGPTQSCPGPKIIRRNDDCLVPNVVTPAPEKLFSYYDANGADLGDDPVPAAIKRVKITFSVQVKNPDPRIGGFVTSTLSSSVEFRN